MTDSAPGTGRPTRSKRADARRNEQALLEAAATVFVTWGVEAPIRDIAAKAGIGTATIYRHFPTRADLIIAVYQHQVEALAEAGPTLLETSPSPHAAPGNWIDLFVDFLVTKQGLPTVLQSDVVPVCTRLLDAAAASGEICSDQSAYELMRGIGGICAGAGNAHYDARRLTQLLITGLRRTQ